MTLLPQTGERSSGSLSGLAALAAILAGAGLAVGQRIYRKR
jgi:LPXTG-motif cell wall-anchored protein